MSPKSLFLVGLVFCFTALSLAQQGPSFPVVLQSANKVLEKSAPDSVVAEEVLLGLQACLNLYPHSSLIPDALLAMAKLQVFLGEKQDAAANASRAASEYPKSDCVGQSSELAMNLYQELGEWQKAVAVGKIYVAHLDAVKPYPPALLSLSRCALQEGDNEFAAQVLNNFLTKFAALPQCVIACELLASVQNAQGKNSEAKQNYSLAWTTYQKNKTKTDYMQSEVVRAAAGALFALESLYKKDFEDNSPEKFSVNKLHDHADEMAEGFKQAMLTDASIAPQCFSATGDVYNRLGDLLLQEGYRESKTNGMNVKNPPYGDAMPEYGKAVAAYSQACDQAGKEESSLEAAATQKYAATRAFEVNNGQGDVMFAWAMEINKSLVGEKGFGTQRSDAQMALIADQIFPVLNQGLDYKANALSLANQFNVVDQANKARETFDGPLRVIADGLFAGCKSQWDNLKSNSVQLASAYARNSEPATSNSLIESTAAAFEATQSFTENNLKLISSLYGRVRDFYPTPEAKRYWDNTLMSFYDDYSSVCHQVQMDMGVCLASLDKSKSDEAASIKNKLVKMQGKSSADEYAVLVKSYDLASKYGIACPESDRMLTRLAGVDPKKYGGILETNSASRKQP